MTLYGGKRKEKEAKRRRAEGQAREDEKRARPRSSRKVAQLGFLLHLGRASVLGTAVLERALVRDGVVLLDVGLEAARSGDDESGQLSSSGGECVSVGTHISRRGLFELTARRDVRYRMSCAERARDEPAVGPCADERGRGSFDARVARGRDPWSRR